MASRPNTLTILSLQYHTAPDERGGAWGLTWEVNKHLVRRGHAVFCITCKPVDALPASEVLEGVRFERIRVSASKNFFHLWRAVRRRIHRLLEETDIDLVHIHNPLIGFFAVLNKRLRNVPKVYHFHSSWVDEERVNRLAAAEEPAHFFFRFKLGAVLAVIRFMERVCFLRTDSLLFLSEYSRRRFLKAYGTKKRRMRVIPGGVDIDLFQPAASETEKTELRRHMNLPTDRPILLTVRRLAARMGLENLILAAGRVVQRHPDLPFLLLIGGKGPLHEKLDRLIRETGLQDRVRLLGFVPPDALPALYRAADIFVLPTVSLEGFGLATVEALASGLPVLGTPVGGTVEILRPIDDKLVFGKPTPESMAVRIESFLENPERFTVLGERCRRAAVEHYSWDQVVDRIEEEFTLLCRKSKS